MTGTNKQRFNKDMALAMTATFVYGKAHSVNTAPKTKTEKLQTTPGTEVFARVCNSL